MRDRNPEGIRNAEKAQHREVTLALFNLTEVGEIQAGSGREGRLGEMLVMPGLANGRTQEREQHRLVMRICGCSVVLSHARLWHCLSGAEAVGAGRHSWSTGINVGEQPGSRQTQDLRETQQGEHRNVALPQLDLANIGVTDAHPSGEGRLGQAALLPVLTEGCPKALQRRLLGVWRVQ